MAFTPWRLALTLAVSGALCGSPALGETPTFIACHGALVTNSTGTKDLTNYYRITPFTLQEWDGARSAWEDDICAKKGYSCSIGDRTYGAEGAYVSDAKAHVKHTLTIDRTTGKIEEYWIVKYGESMFFEGDCKESADPALTSRPNKF